MPPVWDLCAASTTSTSSSANARQSAYFYRNAFGFDVVAYAGLETRVKHEGRLCPPAGGRSTFVLTIPRCPPTTPRAGALNLHGDGVMDIARWDVPDVRVSPLRRRSAAGAKPVAEPTARGGRVRASTRRATILAYGDTTHSFVKPGPLPRRLRPRVYRPIDPERYSPTTFHPVGPRRY